MYWVFFQLTFCQETWFWTRNLKIQSFLEVSWNFWGFGKLPEMIEFLNFNVLSIFPTHFLSRNSVLNSEFKNSIISGSFPKFLGFREIFGKWLFFGQFQHMGYHFHSILVNKLDFQLRFKRKTNIMENWPMSQKFWEDSRIIIFQKKSELKIRFLD